MDNIIIRAAHFARAAHTGQTRDDGLTDYFEGHVARVALRGMLHPEANEALVCALYLHDTIEDCGVTREQIDNEFGCYIKNIVWDLTSSSKQDAYLAKQHGHEYKAPPRAARKKADALYLAGVPRITKIGKMCDRIENLIDTLNAAEPKWAIRYAEESLELFDIALSDVNHDLAEIYVGLIDKIKTKYARIN